MRLRRTPYEMVWQILDYCRNPRRLTHIIQSCNLNTINAQKYLELLIRKEVLEKTGEVYATTSKGLKYLELIEEVYQELFTEQ